ncbi:MAG: 2'-5' RNA ligase family protein [Christensenellales bacterium]|jgi:hypothetical protein
MPLRYALEMFFDELSEKRLRSYFEGLKKQQISSSMLDAHVRPHITIGVFEDIDVERCTDRLRNFCRGRRPLVLSFPSIGLFNLPKPVLFVSPVVPQELLTLHAELQALFAHDAHEDNKVYLPGVWMPHCTLDMASYSDNLLQSTAYVFEHFRAFEGVMERLAWVQMDNASQEVCCFELA